jgi:hypothetical protein
MDSVPRPTQAPGKDQTLAAPSSSPHATPDSHPTGQALQGDPGEDPYSPGLLAFPSLLGSLIALATLTLPLATVLGSRLPAPITTPLIYGSAPAAGFTGARSGEHRGGDPSRQPQ